MKHIIKYDDFLNESINVSDKELLNIAKDSDSYKNFLKKVEKEYEYVLYRGVAEGVDPAKELDSIGNGSFFTDWLEHAEDYGEIVEGIIINNRDVLYFDNITFDDLRKELEELSLKDIHTIMLPYFKEKLYGTLASLKYSEKKASNFVYNFMKSDKEYEDICTKFEYNNLLIPLMLHYAKIKKFNIIKFTGSDYADYGGQDEYVVNDLSKYKRLSVIWRHAGRELIYE